MISNFEAKYYVVSVLYNFLKLHIPIGFCQQLHAALHIHYVRKKLPLNMSKQL